MQHYSDLTRSWSDTLTVFSVGSLAFFLPYVANVDPDGTLSFAFGEVNTLFDFTKDFETAASVILSVMFLSFLLMLGFIIIQFGEFVALLPDVKDRGKRAKKRMLDSSGQAALMLMFTNAYTSYRLLCGIGGLLLLSGLALLLRGIFILNIQTTFSALLFLGLGLLMVLGLARYSFTTLDWIIFGDGKN